jgi:hypothetical protein
VLTSPRRSPSPSGRCESRIWPARLRGTDEPVANSVPNTQPAFRKAHRPLLDTNASSRRFLTAGQGVERRSPPVLAHSVLDASKERHARHFSESAAEFLLKAWVFRCLGRSLRSPVMPISAADLCRGIVAHGKPCLREISLFEIVRRTRPAHLRRNPRGIDGVAQHLGPASCNGECKCSQIELAV